MNLTRRSAAWIAFGVTLPLYLATMNRTIGFIDRGELAAAAWTFGIAHPTGYPTLMLIAGLLARISPLPPVITLNALAALLVAAGAAAQVLLLDRVLAKVGGEHTAPRTRHALALGAGLVTATSLTWWQQANGFEVYALHVLMMPLVTLCFLDWLDAEVGAPGGAGSGDGAPTPVSRRAGLVFALVTGISFTNHGTTLVLAPGLLAAAAATLGPARLLRRIPAMAPAFLLGLLPYAWLPIRAAMQPALNWNHVDSPAAFFHHISGGHYRAWMFDSLDTFATQLRFVAWRLPQDFAWIGVATAAVGLVVLAHRAKPLAWMAGLIALAGIVFAAGYEILDLDAYLLTALFGLSIAMTAGLARLGERLGTRGALAVTAALLAANVVLHVRECDESGHRMVEGRVRDLLAPLPARAVLLTSMWDLDHSPSLYFQEVEGYRRDVVVVNPEMARSSWYVEDLARRAPELTAPIPAETSRLLALLRERERTHGPGTPELTAAYRAFLGALTGRALRDRAVFVTAPFPWIPSGLERVPFRAAYRLMPAGSPYLPEPSGAFAMHPWTGRIDADVAMTAWLQGETRLERARYESGFGRSDLARRALEGAAAFDPQIQMGRVGALPLASQEIVGRCATFYERLNATRDQLASDD